MPVEGRRSRTAKPRATRQPKHNALQRHQRGRRIAEMRARHPKPVAWTEIATVVGMSISGAKDAYAQFLAAEEQLHDGASVVDETIDTLTVALHDALRNMEAAELGSSARTGAQRAVLEAAITRLQIMRAAGRAPRSLAAPSMVAEMQLVFRDFAELLRRHEVSDDALRDFLELAESRMGRLTAVDGRAIAA